MIPKRPTTEDIDRGVVERDTAIQGDDRTTDHDVDGLIIPTDEGETDLDGLVVPEGPGETDLDGLVMPFQATDGARERSR